MLKISRALRVLALSALMLGAVLHPSMASEDAAPGVGVAEGVAAAAAADQADPAAVAAAAAADQADPAAVAAAAAAAAEERARADAAEAEAAAAAAPGADVAAAPVVDVVAAAPVAAAPVAAAPVEAAPVAAAAGAAAPAQDGDGDGDDAGGGAGDGLYFFVKNKGPMRCFVINQGRGSVFHLHYHFPAAEKGKEVRLELRHLPLQGPRRKRLDQIPITTKSIKKMHGSHQFELKNGGAHSLCAVTDSDHGSRGLRLYLDLDTGKEDPVYVNVQKTYKLDDVQISMIQLKNRAKDLLREADFMKELEMDYHKNVLRLNREVLWWPISQVVMLLVMGFFQVRHLKKFFKNKRLV